MIGQLFNTLLYIMLFADVLERRYPEEFKRIMIELSYNCIYAFSKLQIIFGKANTYINKYIETNPTLARIKDNVNAFLKAPSGFPISQVWIKDGKPINIISSGEKVEKNDNFDFQVVSWYSEPDKCVNKLIVYKFEGWKDGIPLSGSSNYKFMLIEIKLGENAYKIDLKTSEFNYNLVGNKFTKEFFIYYLREHSKVTAEIKEDTKISLKLIDHDVNSLHIDFTNNNEYIELEKNSYKTSIVNKVAIENIEEENVIVEDNLEN